MVLDPAGLYEIDERVAAQVPPSAVLLHAVRGFVDSGAVADVVTEHLTSAFEPVRLATFDLDQMLDYRARRPMMTFESTTWTGYEAPVLAIDLLRDAAGAPFLLLHGPEPDAQWERFIAAVGQIVRRLQVALVVGTHGIPMAVPHTRPLTATLHGSRPELVADYPSWFATVQVPASVSNLMEFRLGEAGVDAVGIALHVPHYLSSSRFPAAAQSALGYLERISGLDLQPGLLADAAVEAAEEIERQLAEAEDAAAVVQALENQYDAFARGAGSTESLLATDGPLPTAEELGEQFEQFLAQQRGDGSG